MTGEELTLAAVGIIGLWALGALIVAFRSNFFAKIEEKKLPPPYFGWYALIAFSLYFIFLLLPLVLYAVYCKAFGPCHPTNVSKTIAVDIGIVLSVLVVLLFAYNTRALPFIFGKGPVLKKMAKGALCWLLAYPCAVFLGILVKLFVELFVDYAPSTQAAVQFLKDVKDHPTLFVINAFLLVVVVPIQEELIFRGYLFNALKGFFPFSLALPLSALVFGAIHYDITQGFSNFELLTMISTLGMVLGWIYEKEKSLWASIGLHACFNLVGVLVIVIF